MTKKEEFIVGIPKRWNLLKTIFCFWWLFVNVMGLLFWWEQSIGRLLFSLWTKLSLAAGVACELSWLVFEVYTLSVDFAVLLEGAGVSLTSVTLNVLSRYYRDANTVDSKTSGPLRQVSNNCSPLFTRTSRIHFSWGIHFFNYYSAPPPTRKVDHKRAVFSHFRSQDYTLMSPYLKATLNEHSGSYLSVINWGGAQGDRL